jgi:hypothetical protein
MIAAGDFNPWISSAKSALKMVTRTALAFASTSLLSGVGNLIWFAKSLS